MWSGMRMRAVCISASSTVGELRLEVTDDGDRSRRGRRRREHLCVGLFQARELVANVHGLLKIESAPGHGTRLIAGARLDQGDTC